MTRDPDIERVLDMWFTAGPTQLPDGVFGETLRRVARQPQRRVARLPLRSHDMTLTRFAAFGATAAIVIALVAVGLSSVARPDQTGAGSSPAVTPSPEPTAKVLPTSGPVEPGRYAWAWSSGRVTFTLPAGWSTRSDGYMFKHQDEPTELGLAPGLPGTPSAADYVYLDACHSARTLVRIGGSVDDLVAALKVQTATDATVSDLTIGGRPAHRVVLTISPSVDRASCRDGLDGGVRIWADQDETTFFAFPFDAPGGASAYVVDVDGHRVVFTGGATPRSSDADRAEIEAVIESMAFEVDAPAT